MGVELPPSGRGTFQRIFLVSLHSSGRFFCSVTPVPWTSPRQVGQWATHAVVAKTTMAGRNGVVFMTVVLAGRMGIGSTFFHPFGLAGGVVLCMDCFTYDTRCRVMLLVVPARSMRT